MKPTTIVTTEKFYNTIHKEQTLQKKEEVFCVLYSLLHLAGKLIIIINNISVIVMLNKRSLQQDHSKTL